jgi:hypothetical protein
VEFRRILDGALWGFREPLCSKMSPHFYQLGIDFVQTTSHQILQKISFVNWDHAFLRTSPSSCVLSRNNRALPEENLPHFSGEILRELFTDLDRWENPQMVRKAFLLWPSWVILMAETEKICFLCIIGARDSSVGIATGYGLDGPGIKPRWGQDFSNTSRPALGPTQPPTQWVPGFSRG